MKKEIIALTKLTPAIIRMRRAIARDVLLQVERGCFIPKRGTYFKQRYEIKSPVGDLQKFVKNRITAKNPCQVCGLGAALLSIAKLYDSYQIEVGEDITCNMHHRLREFFTEAEISVIESVFERFRMSWSGEIVNEWNNMPKFVDFIAELTDGKRMTFVMETIATRADRPLTLKVFAEEALYSLGFDKRYASTRTKLGW